nr:histidine kinase [Paenibacillus castaneae]
MAPITKSLQIFYATLIVLVILAFLASFIFYKNVQLPIRSLVSRLRAVAKGNYSVRLDRTSNYEFQFLNDQFNHMAQQIEELIETDYKSQIRLQEAGLRLLQSQIDPHFLYNCLFFIKNNARLGNEEGVVAMSLNLGMYYRYSTKLSNSETSIREELEMIENYLNIHNLRLNRIRYEIEFPDDMMNLQIPRLLLQPIVENAIIHGIEPKMREGLIKLRGISLIDEYQIIIEDNGTGISDQQLDELLKHINFHNPGTSFGLWNINQRMKIRFGGNSQLYCSSSALGGLKISLVWKKQTGE